MTEYRLGKEKSTGKIVEINKASRGLACNCVCPDCGKDFIAAQGSKMEWHFRHNEKTSCKGGQETALHLLAKEIIASNSKIDLPTYGTISYSNPIKEKYFHTILPDVSATTNERPLFFEVMVTHAVDETKENFYVSGEHKSVEIDLQDYEFTTLEELENEVLKNCENKRIIFWENISNTENPNKYAWVIFVIFGILAFLGFKSLTKNRRR